VIPFSECSGPHRPRCGIPLVGGSDEVSTLPFLDRKLGILPGKMPIVTEGVPVPGTTAVSSSCFPPCAAPARPSRAIRHAVERQLPDQVPGEGCQFLSHLAQKLPGRVALVLRDFIVESQHVTEQDFMVPTRSKHQGLGTMDLPKQGLRTSSTDVGDVGKKQRLPGTADVVAAIQVAEPLPQFWVAQVGRSWLGVMCLASHKYLTSILLQQVNTFIAYALTLFHNGANISGLNRRNST